MIENELSEFDKKLIKKIVSLPIERIVPARKTIENYNWYIHSFRISIVIIEMSYGFMIHLYLNESTKDFIYTLIIDKKDQNYHYCLLRNYLKGLPVILEYDLINQIEHL